MNPPDLSKPGIWASLFPSALTLMAHLEGQINQPHWTFGGGTVLMLRIGHRLSKDIDLFVPDPQYLGYINPRLSDVGERVSTEYAESAEWLRFFLKEGEIDVVVGAGLTAHPFDLVQYQGRTIKVETCAEIIAKKMWHRGHHAKARDLYDLCAVAEMEPEALQEAGPFMIKHGAAFIAQLENRADIVREQFAAIEVIGHRRKFEDCFQHARNIIESAIDRKLVEGTEKFAGADGDQKSTCTDDHLG